MISYVSTRGGKPQAFENVLLEGLAADGGLYVPETWPQIDSKNLKNKPYNEIAEAVMSPFVGGSISPDIFRALIDDSYDKSVFPGGVAPLKEIYPGLHVMELFHGPTIAFKDVALQLLGRLFDHVLQKKNEKITIVGATSGDTGSAAIEGCRHSDRVEIFILHPHGRVSEVQRRQMTTVDVPNVHNIAVQGTFDDCQALVKTMFNDKKFREQMRLSAVNSINWARIMAQVVYYVQASVNLGGASFVVPTGNFGNAYAAYVARKIGAPVKNLTIATNRNDILTRFFETGEMKQKGVSSTISPSMDIQISSNFERYLFDLLGRDTKKLVSLMEEFKAKGKFSVDEKLAKQVRTEFSAQRCDENETLAIMKKVHAQTGYLLDPHSAVGASAALKLKGQGSVVTLATAHPAKFPDAVHKATGVHPPLPDHLKTLLDKPEKLTVLPADIEQIKAFIAQNA